ncbi:peptidoglycan endopeptidase [Pseudoxanthomonas winnipegensis]|nr:peptidoglycan endopeptidase [Pseudoxanthomonas winnipegensis]TAA42199.1 peptidoglycan endopeptidase [Pseudoxanthomonas winnipegensis]
MRASALDPFIGRAYDPDSFDCVDLVREASLALFGRHIELPGGHPRGLKRLPMVSSVARQLAVPTDTPRDGDLVLMFDRGLAVPTHVGLYFWLAHRPWVLHVGAGVPFSTTHAAADLPKFGAKIEGIYTWAS